MVALENIVLSQTGGKELQIIKNELVAFKIKNLTDNRSSLLRFKASLERGIRLA